MKMPSVLEFELAGKGTLPSVSVECHHGDGRNARSCWQAAALDLERSLLGMMVFWMLPLS